MAQRTHAAIHREMMQCSTEFAKTHVAQLLLLQRTHYTLVLLLNFLFFSF